MTEVGARIATFSCLHAATDHGTAGCPQAIQISITAVVVASGKGHRHEQHAFP